MPAMVLISVLLPAPLSPTSAVTWPAGTSRSMSVSARTGPKFLPMPARRSSGVAPFWPGSGAGARPAVAGRASSALGVVTGRASSDSGNCWASRYSRALAGGRVGADAQLRGLHELVRDDGRGHVGCGDPLRREQHRRHRAAAL